MTRVVYFSALTTDSNVTDSNVTDALKSPYENYFFNLINADVGVTGKGGNKLRTYALFKTEYGFAKYLTMNVMSNIAKLRTSTHNLSIETGRYTCPTTPSNQRYLNRVIMDKLKMNHISW